jgi:hypothetical protein
MPTVQATAMKNRIYDGAHGNLSLAKSKIVLVAAAAGTVVELFELQPGIDVQTVRVTVTALGTGVTGTIALGGTTIKSGQSLATAVTVDIPCDVLTTAKTTLTLTTAGGVATGTVNASIQYVAKGY